MKYADAARFYSLPYYTFIQLAREAGANIPMHKTVIVDLDVMDEFMEQFIAGGNNNGLQKK